MNQVMIIRLDLATYTYMICTYRRIYNYTSYIIMRFQTRQLESL